MLDAFGDAEGAALGEAAARGMCERIGGRALDRGEALALESAAVDAGHGVDEGPAIGMPRVGEKGLRRPFLDHLARVHHDDARAHAGDDAEIVADQHDGGAEVAR